LKDWSLWSKTLYDFAYKTTKSGIAIMECATESLAKTADAKLRSQRLDSAHVRSNMAKH
jgi:hypothetical protein